MNTSTLSESEIQAYVDGHLSPEHSAQVEAYLAEHPDIDKRVKSYQEQNRMLHGLFDHVLAEPLPDKLAAVTARKSWHKRYWVAAMMGWFIIGGLTGYLWRGEVTHTVMVSVPFAERAAIAHVVYTAEMLHPVEVGADQDSHLVQWLARRLGHPLHTPDLSKFGYQLMGGRLLPGNSKGVAAQFMYQTTVGRRLTLYISVKDKGTGQTAFRIADQDGQQVMYWAEDNLSFALIGETDHQRLLEMAQVTYQAMSF